MFSIPMKLTDVKRIKKSLLFFFWRFDVNLHWIEIPKCNLDFLTLLMTVKQLACLLISSLNMFFFFFVSFYWFFLYFSNISSFHHVSLVFACFSFSEWEKNGRRNLRTKILSQIYINFAIFGRSCQIFTFD